MRADAAEITRVLVARGRHFQAGRSSTLSAGVETAGGRRFWGDCPVSTSSDQIARSADLLAELGTVALRGQRLERFRDLCMQLDAVGGGAGEMPPELFSALQQALLAGVSHDNDTHPANVLAAEYGLAAPSTPSVFLEISDFAATAEKIDAMLALRPDGIGYRLTGNRVAEAIGGNGEYLQRFVRELAQRATHAAEQIDSRPAIYLGLRGALGVLVDDPIRQIGKILGNCVGLRDAAGAGSLYLEEPFLLEDATVQPAHLLRLKDFLRRSSGMARPPSLAFRAAGLTDEQLALYSDLRPVDAAVFDVPLVTGIDRMMSRVALMEHSGMRPIFDFSPVSGAQVTRRWEATMTAAAMACHSAILLLSCDDDPVERYLSVIRRIAEADAGIGLA